ncbi:hypothetical protein SAMN05216186_10396 [Pseudomonas indica]|uniref:Uncharacterized protein n=1 Tax=Pseudomonas indica TaxID=137658 RepID=A0A1G8X6Q7_9PSED|nr:hypothetical protein SAMN05216186_10396 [Pseudomonas indica]
MSFMASQEGINYSVKVVLIPFMAVMSLTI